MSHAAIQFVADCDSLDVIELEAFDGAMRRFMPPRQRKTAIFIASCDEGNFLSGWYCAENGAPVLHMPVNCPCA